MVLIPVSQWIQTSLCNLLLGRYLSLGQTKVYFLLALVLRGVENLFLNISFSFVMGKLCRNIELSMYWVCTFKTAKVFFKLPWFAQSHFNSSIQHSSLSSNRESEYAPGLFCCYVWQKPCAYFLLYKQSGMRNRV